MDFKFSDIKDLFVEYNMCRDEVNEFVDNVMEGENDFTIGDYRYISSNAIDEIMCEDLKSDLYILGCFNAWFLVDILDIDLDVIEEMQKCEAYTAIGKLVLSLGKLEELQKAYVSADGYGAHFNRYDGCGEEMFFNGDIPSFYVFSNG